MRLRVQGTWSGALGCWGFFGGFRSYDGEFGFRVYVIREFGILGSGLTSPDK